MDQDADLYGDVYTGIAPVHQQQHYVGGGSPALGGPPLLQQPPLALAEPFSGIAGSDGDVAVLRQQLAQTLADLQRSQAAEQQLRQELAAQQQREAVLQAEACLHSAESLQLRRELAAARQAADPSVVQLRQVLLDPAVNREVSRLRTELEARTREFGALQEELSAVAFAGPDGKAGRMLVAKCRALQEENDDLTRQVSEGRVASLERALAATRDQLGELKAAYSELEDHAHALDDEAELLQQQLLLGRRHPPGPGPPELVMPPRIGGRGRGGGFGGRGGGPGGRGPPMPGRGFFMPGRP